MIRRFVVALIVLSAAILFLGVGCASIERTLLFHPTHNSADKGLTPWSDNGKIIGYARPVESPKNVWLMLHGNAGQASGREYAIPSFPSDDSVYVLEYPGYGKRPGTPCREAINQAAKDAYLRLRKEHPTVSVCVAGESLGSGPASSLALLNPPPDKLVLIVPFDRLSLVAREHFPGWLVSLLLKDDWNNVEALSNYKGPVEIFGAEGDTVIPIGHAKALAAAAPSSRLVVIEGGHNDWSQQGKVSISNQ